MPQDNPKSRLPAPILLIGGLLIVIILLTLTLRRSRESANEPAAGKSPVRPASNSSATLWPGPLRHPPSASSGTNSAEAILARKMTQFSKKQRAIFEALAKKHNVTVPDDVKRFFDAVDANNWEEAHALFKALREPGYDGAPGREDLRPFWRPILDTYGAMEMAQRMPAQEYLDYGNAVLGSLKPGMIYVGGTDSGMFIPNMMNATSDGDQHIVFTQNALADNTYLDYLSYLYGDQLKTLTADQSQQAFSAQQNGGRRQRRYQHDQQFPDEPKQLLPGENITVTDGKVSVSGQTAVMAINENLFQRLVLQNPGVSFAIEQSFPFNSTYPGAIPLGPIMQVGNPVAALGLSPDTAQQAVSYWQNTTQQLLANPEAAGSADTLKTYSHDATTQADMLAANQQPGAAEQTYNLASQLSPTNFEAIAGLSTVLYQNGQSDQAIQILNDFAQRNPNQQTAVDRQRTTLTTAKR